MPKIKKKCQHGRQRNHCKECGGSSICEHQRLRNTCKECGGASICEHKRQKSQCKECGGSSICEHKRRRSTCKECVGSSICEHKRERSTCKECGGASICEHQKQRSSCKECGGASICEHQRLRNTCKECGGSSICEHQKQRSTCKECGGASICEHQKQRSQCKECGGASICEHKRQKSQCKECDGSRICQFCKQTLTSTHHPFCAPCFYHLNPDLPQTRNYLTKQKYLRSFILKEINYPFSYDVQVDGGCSKKRPDFLFDCLTHSVLIENDELQHAGVQCEEKRIMTLFEDLGNRPLVVLRFNPDNYRDDENNLIQGAFELDDKNVLQVKEKEWQRRWLQLKERLLYYLAPEIPNKEVTIEYFFYSKIVEMDENVDDLLSHV